MHLDTTSPAAQPESYSASPNASSRSRSGIPASPDAPHAPSPATTAVLNHIKPLAQSAVFGPGTEKGHEDNRVAASQVNAQIKRLARVLTAPFWVFAGADRGGDSV